MKQEINKLKARIAELERQLQATHKYDWDSGNVVRFFEQPDWDDWENCPVGTLAAENDIDAPYDNVLYHLGSLTGFARVGDWDGFVTSLREAVRLYIKVIND